MHLQAWITLGTPKLQLLQLLATFCTVVQLALSLRTLHALLVLKHHISLQAQEISLNFHCKCEQYVQFASGSFFNFNGTAGIWRRKTIITVGGWKSRTTVEDMDLSLRTFVNGWKAIYLTETTCINEVSRSCTLHSACMIKAPLSLLHYLLQHVVSVHMQQVMQQRHVHHNHTPLHRLNIYRHTHL